MIAGVSVLIPAAATGHVRLGLLAELAAASNELSLAVDSAHARLGVDLGERREVVADRLERSYQCVCLLDVVGWRRATSSDIEVATDEYDNTLRAAVERQLPLSQSDLDVHVEWGIRQGVEAEGAAYDALRSLWEGLNE